VQIPAFLKKHIEFIKFLIVGGWNTLFGYGVFIAIYYSPVKINYIIVAIISNVLAITNAYVGYKFFVFKTRGNYFKEYLKFYGIYGTMALINLALLPVLVQILSIKPVISQGILLAGTVVASFFGHKRFSFRAKEPSQ
jgi:putative flippase GtrA